MTENEKRPTLRWRRNYENASARLEGGPCGPWSKPLIYSLVALIIRTLHDPYMVPFIRSFDNASCEDREAKDQLRNYSFCRCFVGHASDQLHPHLSFQCGRCYMQHHRAVPGSELTVVAGSRTECKAEPQMHLLSKR